MQVKALKLQSPADAIAIMEKYGTLVQLAKDAGRKIVETLEKGDMARAKELAEMLPGLLETGEELIFKFHSANLDDETINKIKDLAEGEIKSTGKVSTETEGKITEMLKEKLGKGKVTFPKMSSDTVH